MYLESIKRVNGTCFQQDNMRTNYYYTDSKNNVKATTKKKKKKHLTMLLNCILLHTHIANDLKLSSASESNRVYLCCYYFDKNI